MPYAIPRYWQPGYGVGDSDEVVRYERNPPARVTGIVTAERVGLALAPEPAARLGVNSTPPGAAGLGLGRAPTHPGSIGIK